MEQTDPSPPDTSHPPVTIVISRGGEDWKKLFPQKSAIRSSITVKYEGAITGEEEASDIPDNEATTRPTSLRKMFSALCLRCASWCNDDDDVVATDDVEMNQGRTGDIELHAMESGSAGYYPTSPPPYEEGQKMLPK